MNEYDLDRSVVLAFDTSAYTTSVAAVEKDGNTLAEDRRLLEVKVGERGLRQSDAFFQHIARLPELTNSVCKRIREKSSVISAIAVSTRPRPKEDSYMPVFMAGFRMAESVSAVLDVPLYCFSHQEGHIAAVAGVRPKGKKALAVHLSGGTTELLVIDGCCPEKIVGGSRDLSFGQLIDRTGVAFGLPFPSGKWMDEAALRGEKDLRSHLSRRRRRIYENAVLSEIHRESTELNLSGIETTCMKAAADGINLERTAAELFQRISDAVVSMVAEAGARENINEVILVGGVASSQFLRRRIQEDLSRQNMKTIFGPPPLCSDNSVGIARLGMDAYLSEQEYTCIPMG